MATNTSTTTQTHNGTGSQNNFAISFPFLANSEVEVTVGGVLKTLGTHYNIVGSEVQFTAGNTPPNVTANIIFNRDTNISAAKVDFTDGSVLTEIDLDNNGNQVLFAQQEIINDYVKRDGSQTITGNLVFEGATNDNNETTLAITDPTADRTITIPDITGTVVTTGDTGTVTSTMITNNTIVDADVNASAAIQGTKINPNFGSQNIATTGNTTIGGTLGVTSNTTVGGTLEVTGTSTFTGAIDANGGASIDNIQIGVTGDNEIDTASGNLTIDSAGGTTTIDDALTVSGNATLQGTLGVTSNTTVGGTLGATSNTTVGGTLGVTGTTTVPNITGDAVITSGTSTSDTKVYSAKRAGEIFYGKDTVEEIQSGETWSSADDKVATTAAIDARIIDLVDDVGGFVPIASETVFPNANPDINDPATGGTIVSIKEIGSSRTPSSGTVTISNGNVANNATITITGCGSTVLAAGFGVLVETTSTIHTYAFHRLVPKATEVTTVAGKATEITTVHTNITNINAVADNATNINAVAADATDIGAVAGKATEIGRLGTADAVADMAILGTADVVADLNTLGTADIVSDMNALAVADVISDMNTLAVADVISDMNDLATSGNITAMSNCSGSISSINNASSNLTSINNFGDKYQIASSNPSTDGGGNALAAGDLYFNTSANELKIYTGSAWVSGVTQTGNFALTTGNTFTGNNIFTAHNTYNDNVKLKIGSSSDLEIYHDGTHSRIKHSGSGTQELLLSGNIISLNNAASNEYMLKGTENGAVELYHDNVKKLETTSAGISVTGGVITTDDVNFKGSGGSTKILFDALQDQLEVADNAAITFGDHPDVTLSYSNGNDFSIAGQHNGSGDIVTGFKNNAGAIIKSFVAARSDGAAHLYHAGDQQLHTETQGVAVQGRLRANGSVIFQSTDASTAFQFNAGNVSAARFQAFDNRKFSCGDDHDLQIYHDGSDSYIEDTGTGALMVKGSSIALRSSSSISLRNLDNSENLLRAITDGAVELYYDSSKKFETNSAGVKVTGQIEADEVYLRDSEKILLGTGSDLQIYHDGSHTYANNTTGFFHIRSGSAIRLQKSDGEPMIYAIPDGAVELYYDNSKKFETRSGGAAVFGHLELGDNDKVMLGDSNDLQIYHDGTHSHIKDASTGELLLSGSVISLNSANSQEYMIKGTENAGLELYYDNSKKLETQTQGIFVSGSLGVSRSGTPRAFNHASNGVTATKFEVDAGDTSASTFETACFRGGNDGNGAAARVRICHGGDRGLVIDGGRTSNAAFGAIGLTDQNGGITASVHINNSGTWYWGKTGQSSATNGVELGIDYPNFMTRGADGGTVLGLNDSTGTSGTIMRFYYQDSLKGSLNFNGSTFSTQTHSDYRLKENDTPISDGIARVKQLRPIKFNWKNNSSTTYDGFFAHEVQAVVPAAVTGEKDAEVNSKGEGYQAISQEGLIPLLTAGLKDAIAKIEVLETKVAALEAA